VRAGSSRALARTDEKGRCGSGTGLRRKEACGIVALACALCACIGVPLHTSSVEKDLPGKVASVVAGETDRTQVRQALGGPIISSQYWRFDAFRITEWNTGVIVFGGGIPVPVWGKEDGYILVAYDERGRAAEVQYGLRSYDWSVGEQPATVTVRNLQLRATGKEAFLAVPPDRRDRYLHDVPIGDRCRVLIGAVEWISDVALVVDGRSGPTLPKTMNDTLLVLVLMPASHRIEFPGKVPAIANLRCESGATYYVAVKPSASHKRSFELSLSTEAPNGFADQALLIWGNGQWLVDAEPDQRILDPERQ
jgi:hypothetical protein